MSYAMKSQELDAMRLDLGKKFLSVTKDGNETIIRRTQEYYKQGFASHKFLQTNILIEGRVERINESTQFGSELLESSDVMIKKIGMDYAGFVDSHLMKNYDQMGGSTFQDLTASAEDTLDVVEKQGNYLKTELIPGIVKEIKQRIKAKESADDLVKTLAGLKNVQKANVKDAKLNVALAKEHNIISQQTATAAELITGPFKKLQGILESTSMGKFASEIVGVDQLMGDFTKKAQTQISNALDPKNPMTFGDAMFNIKKSGMKAVKGLQEGFTKLGEVFGSINKAMGGMLGPMIAIVAIIAIAGKLAKMFYGGIAETRKEFGLTFKSAATLQATLNATTMEFKMMGVSAEDVKAGAQGIMDNLGGIGQVTRANLQTFASLNATLGLSGESAGVLASQMMAVGAGSIEAVGAQLESVGALAAANGVAPAKVLEDVAGASEAFANFAKDGGQNIFKAAISARKLGISMETVAGTADALLDFESSINAQMEASMLTGRNINTDKARELALAGDLDGMQREITKQIGSAAEYEKLNVVQRKSLAAAFGVSVSELGKMVTNQDKLNNMTEAQVKRTDLIASLVQGLNSAWVAVMESLKPIIPLAIGILSPILLIVAAFAGVIVIVGKVLAMFNKLSVGGIGLGDVVMFITGVFIAYKLAMMAHAKVAKISSAVTWLQTVATQAYNAVKKKGIILIVKDAAMQVWNKAVTIAGTVAKWAATAATAAFLVIQNLSIGSTIRETAAMIWKNTLMVFSTAATWAATAAQWALNVAMAANPIGLIILGVIALVAVIVLLFKKFNLFPKIIGGVMKVFSVFKIAVMTALKFAFAPLFLAYEVFKKVKGFIGKLFGGGDKSKEAGAAAPTSNRSIDRKRRRDRKPRRFDPEMHSGGMVTGTGTATVQKGEAVLTEQQQGSMMSTQAMESKLDELIQLMGQQGPIALGVNQTKVHTGRMADSII